MRFLPLKSQFLLTGNVRDRHPWQAASGRSIPLTLVDFLGEVLRDAGVADVIAFDPVNGFWLPRGDQAESVARLGFLGLSWNEDGRAPATTGRFFEVLPHLVRSEGSPVAMVADFSSRFLLRPDLPTSNEHTWFTTALVLAHDARPRPVGPGSTPLFNPVVWIADKEGDLPPWLVIGNPRLRSIPVPVPDRTVRAQIASTLTDGLPGAKAATAADREVAARTLVEHTEGLLLVDLVAIADLCRREAVSLHALADGVRRYKLGVTENPWATIDRAKISGAEHFVSRRIKGQHHAVTKMLDIIKRSVMGVSGETSRSGRPRGVAFLAGPTGTGKTELAKTITELLFGDESACIRFDMSEFSAEHSDQRLIGAPPGYIGCDVGGELTNAVREKPFSVVLFDEIEKAHPRILDKFLQVLDDGVLTSGRGERVYFSEAFLVFTSNLGITSLNSDGHRVASTSPADSFEQVSRKIREGIEAYFKIELGRPEILNRIGENIIVFDFIRPDIAEAIFEMMLGNFLNQASRASGREITVKNSARETLQGLCLADLSHGGRGIRNQLEAHLLNPLARALFELTHERSVEISELNHEGEITTLLLR